MSDREEWTYRIGKLAPKPGEIIVIKADVDAYHPALERLREQVRALFDASGHPNQPLMIVGREIDFMIIDPADFGPKE